MLFRAGWNAAQVQLFLGHHKPSFTLDTYIHLLPKDVPEPAFLDAMVGNGRATQATEIGSAEPSRTLAEVAV